MMMTSTAAWRSWPSKHQERTGQRGGQGGGRGRGYLLRPQSPPRAPVSPEGCGEGPPSRVGGEGEGLLSLRHEPGCTSHPLILEGPGVSAGDMERSSSQASCWGASFFRAAEGAGLGGS